MAGTPITDSNEPAPGRTRRYRSSEVVRDALVNAAISEFAAHGFNGASTRRMAEAAGTYQSQIKYHFNTKDELWRRCLDRLLAELDATIAEATDHSRNDPLALVDAAIRGLVRFAAKRPQLSRIMMHEATSPSDRLTWLVEEHSSQRQALLTRAWSELRKSGAVAPIDSGALYHTLIGAASLLYANAPEAQLMGVDPSDPELVERHADALVAIFLSAPTTR
ncbi:MAG: TetR/AcrR family transcriptional regulator [Actinomycetota bacterium]